MGLYRDDGLLILRGAAAKKKDKTRKNIIEIFKIIGFKIDIMAVSVLDVNFLDVTFNLTKRNISTLQKTQR